MITTDVSMQAIGHPFHGHVQLALRLGLSDDEIRDAVRFTAELCSARTVAALAALDRILPREAVS
jgi:alkylhydroperoxidase/carboxymuconolactone decarboxylase family protein YurZ